MLVIFNMSITQTFDNLKTSYFTTNVGVGGSGGTPFIYGDIEDEKPSSGNIVRSMKFWYDENLKSM